ncbi:unknown [Clostridium sp. CAG:470]|nr:unknown [Clostridium sp. CAG:470]
MMNNTTRRKQLIRDWRIKKIGLYIISLLIIFLGTILTAKGIVSDPIKKPWQFITGFVICVFGVFSMIDAYHWKFKNYLSKKMKKAR